MAMTGLTTGAENVIVWMPVAAAPPMRRRMSLSGGPLSNPGAVKIEGFDRPVVDARQPSARQD